MTRGRGGWLGLARTGLPPVILCQLPWRTKRLTNDRLAHPPLFSFCVLLPIPSDVFLLDLRAAAALAFHIHCWDAFLNNFSMLKSYLYYESVHSLVDLQLNLIQQGQILAFCSDPPVPRTGSLFLILASV